MTRFFVADPPNFFDEIPDAPPEEQGPWSKTPPRRRRKKPAPELNPVAAVNGHDIETADQILPPDFADDALGLRFTATFAPSLRFVATWNRWMLWNGQVWKKDDTLRVYDLVRRSCRTISDEAGDAKTKFALASARTVAAIEKLVRSDRRHASSAEQWDADPWLLNTPAGIVDLRTGETSEHDANHLMTKSTAVAPAGDCPLWREFLDRVTGNDRQLADFLKRIAGYCLTGITAEHAMFFAYGTGRNGKGVFLNTLVRIMGDYAMTASPDTFTEAGAGKHLTVLARLQGARLVVSQETEEGTPWAEARIKGVTGGDPITANHMRQDPFTYLPQFKLFIAGNHKPGLRSVDEAIRARFNLIPFTVTIPVAERDPGLSEKLWAEAPGILAWAIEGCSDWRAVRLRPPAVVSKATEDYFDQEDATALWIADCCLRNGSELSGLLFKSWAAWAARAGEKAGSHKAFSRTMEKHGFVADKRTENGIPLKGIRLIPPPSSFLEPDHERAWP
jgi:P4 family phage/plasmid primase-like protien